MKNKLILICTILIFIFTSLISVNAIAITPRIDLDEYEIITTDKNNVSISGIVTVGKGQLVGVYDSSCKILYAYTQLKNSGSQESFTIQVPARYLNEGTNTFKVKSLPVKDIINGSNPKTFTVKINSIKQNQTIIANDISLKVNEKKNLNAKSSSGLSLSYKSDNISIATVDNNGNVVGRNIGTTKITISQSGNLMYNPASKVINVTVIKDNTTSSTTKKNQSIKSIDTYQFYDINKTYKLNATASSGLNVTYRSSNPKIVSVDSKGNLKSKNPGTTKITITQSGNSNYRSTVKNVTVKVPKLKNRQAALKPWYNAMKKQADWSQGCNYGFSATIKASKYNATCITFPSVSLQRCKIIKSGQYITASTDHYGSNKASCIARSKKAVKSINSKYMTLYEVNGKAKNLIKKGKILPGDILGLNWHDCVYYGKDKKGNNRYSDGGRVRAGDYATNTNHVNINKINSSDNNSTVWLIARVNTFDIKTSCVNGNVTQSNKYMAAQNITINYSPNSGKKLQSVTVDGKKINIKKYPKSYTFKKLDRNHTVSVIFN